MHTQGKWVYNENNHSIESNSEYIIEPDEDDKGIHTSVISTYCTMGGNDPNSDIKLICAAPEMLDFLYNLVHNYDPTKGGLLTTITLEEIEEAKRLINLATGINW